MKMLPLSVPFAIAGHYQRDAIDFARRFDVLWEDQLHKTGRIKSFVDLVMGCECALKSHAFLGRLDQDPDETYRLIRRAGHDTQRLSRLANFLKDRELYERVGSSLAPFSVFIRYSLDAYATFFPALDNWDDASVNHRATIGNHAWVMDVRGDLEKLIEVASDELSGIVSHDVSAIVQHERDMEAFMRRVAPNHSLQARRP